MSCNKINKMSLSFICHPKNAIVKCSPCERTDIVVFTSKGKRFKKLPSCRKRKNIKQISPQYTAFEIPSKFFGHKLGYTPIDNGYKCHSCVFTAKKTNTIQQHCLQHFPGKYPCLDCGDVFHIKTQHINHQSVECLTCLKTIKRGSIASHNCKLNKQILMNK